MSKDVDKQLRLIFLMTDRVGEEGITYKIVVISFGAYFFLQTLLFLCVYFLSAHGISIGIRNINSFIVQLMYKVELIFIIECKQIHVTLGNWYSIHIWFYWYTLER